MEPKRLKTWQRALLYSAFGIVALFLSLIITFPYEGLQQRVQQEAERQGYLLKVGSMGPGFFRVRASDIKISKKPPPDTEGLPPPLHIDSVSVGPTLFPPGVFVKANLMEGSVKARVGGLTGLSVHISADDVDLSKGNLKAFSGVDLSGIINADVDLAFSKNARAGSAFDPDFSTASGSISAEGKGLSVNGGNISVALPQYGPEPIPLDLPKIVLGDLNSKITVEKGAGKIDEFKSKSTDLELNASGSLKMNQRLEYSEPNVEVRLKTEPEFVNRLGMIGGALSMLNPDPKDPNFRLGKLTGSLGRPNFH